MDYPASAIPHYRASLQCIWPRPGIADWRFEPAEGETSARDRVEGTFRLNPYAEGEVRDFARALASEWSFAARRPVTIEARLYLNGQYQTLVETQAVIRGGPHDPDLASAVASATANLFGVVGCPVRP